MRDEKDHNEQRLDDFSDYMRQRLEEHRLPVEAGCWEEVESRIGHQRRYLRSWLWGGGLAAAILALVIWLLPSPERMSTEESGLFQERISEEINVLPEPPVLPPEPERKHMATARRWEKRVKPSHTAGEEDRTREDGRRETIEVVRRDTVAGTADEPVETVSEDSTVTVVKRSDSTVPPPDGERSLRGKASLKVKAGKDRKNKWLLAAIVGTGGYVDLNRGMSHGDSPMEDMNSSLQEPAPNNPDKDDEETGKENTSPLTASFRSASVLRSGRVDENFLENRSFESYPDVSHSLPISFGLTVRKELGRRIALESGLVYTYLSSTFRQGGDSPSEVRSSLHYLGIPLNLVVSLWKNQRWNVYLSGGLMAEKGLQAVYSGYIAGNGTTLYKSEKEGIHGLQWSVNASVGAAYRFYGDWSVYFEPRLSHYFDCDQPASIRTDRPLGLGLSAGVRYAF